MPTPAIEISYQPPMHGWLIVTLSVDAQTLVIDASDVPNNPIENLLAALELAANGVPSTVWWNMEPDGYFMHFTPNGDRIELKIDFANDSRIAGSENVLVTEGSREKILMPFWRFVREFQSHDFQEPDWPPTDYDRINATKARIEA